MPLDPSIALSVKPTPFNNPFEVLAQMQHLKAQAQVINSNQALEEQRRARIKQDEDDEKRKTAVAQAITDLKAGNHEAVLANLDPQSRLLAEEWLTKDADTKRQRAVLQRKDLQDRAQLIRAFDYNPAIAEIQFGLIADDFPEASKSWEDVKGDPAKLRALVDRVADIDAKPAAAPEGFSLSPGQSRFDPTGKQIANVPATAAPSAAPQDFTLTPGGVRFDASGKQIASVPAAEKVASEPGSIDAAIAAARNDPMELNRLLAIKRKMAEATREPQGPKDVGPLETIIGPNGKPIRVPREQAIGKETVAGQEKPSSGVQKRVLNFFNRAQQADTELEGMEEQIQQKTLPGQLWQDWAPNFAQTQLGQSYAAAQRAFTEARLRKDSGAAIPPAEFENDKKTYFAQAGDSKETLEQKRRARAAMLASLGFEAGQALGEFVGNPDEAKAIVEGYKARAEKGNVPAGPKKPTAEELKKRAADLIKKHGG